MPFHERLKSLRISKNISQPTVALECNISYRMYQYYETGTKQPTLDKLITLAKYFNVSIDYLVGRTDNPELATLDRALRYQDKMQTILNNDSSTEEN